VAVRFERAIPVISRAIVMISETIAVCVSPMEASADL
jgi:hypothetical protein